MPRPRSAHVLEVKAALAARLRSDFAHPGGRFLSTRAVAQRFSVSYQTAHRLLAELSDEGMLRRQAASGSYVPGVRATLRGVQLIFHPRARRKESFGAHLLELLVDALAAKGIAVTHSWPDASRPPRLRPDHFPVVWESSSAVQAAAESKRFALCLNDHPPSGLGGSYVDAVTTDDFSGGACAAELLRQRTGRTSGFAVLGGPRDDPRSLQRIAGFRRHAAGARVVHAASWFVEAGGEHAAAMLAARPAGIFACNDRLAEAIIRHCRTHERALPPLVGFDNAPVAERLRLTTIGIPWGTMVTQAVELIAARLAGSTASARLISLAHEPTLRLTC
ncbi:substrate-binding domain-containing protein [Horticoccus sp. 23ND18S-11]|uniref:substrate-binding domain-containing protein n=1 Tax=Horticoccus sp. 23ND18S-11 TaxID=3391832 RepID=UPI0039C9F1BE